MKRYIPYSILTVLLFSLITACKKDYADPSGPSAEQAYSTPATLAADAVGLQAWYAKDRVGLLYNTVTSASLLCYETFVTNRGNTDEAQVGDGGTKIQNTNAVVTQMWGVSNKIRYEADSIMRRTNAIVTDKGFASGIIAYASIFKAMAIGVQANFWEQVPASMGRPDTVTNDVKFIPGSQGYTLAVATLDNALNTIATTPIGSNFTPNVPSTVNIINTLYALKARYALCAGDYATALAAADKVDLKVTSVLAFNQQITNPVFTLVTATSNIYNVADSSMGLPVGLRPDKNDQRIPFYILYQAPPKKPALLINGFFKTNVTAVPIYLPGEITLIKAECYARQHNLPAGLAELNKVVTKSPSADAFGVGAQLPPAVAATEADLLTLIYKHRRIELFMSGQELEDNRRFGRPQAERGRNYFPYPFVERNDNPNTPADPAF
ncbi:MAG: RagB/SusD family nutrient uptake outer membrane protein [Chitinophaga sp.]|uniref:RagB/SusD family nutrient uptake outer membrane protein n=1 Tax=Chitinophaga sp. TaxID=1869181 RepID=UPI001B000509|nr:RagB/SusD family nutrient uptake outer membrane protein [Chitinophaga sp.]MBO9729526.1 RagB/SusD family nutrient uptake outer membrane protein [Chitinophaga sp.]